MLAPGRESEPLLDLNEGDGVQSVDKALAVLDALADESCSSPVSQAELARRTGLHRSSVNRSIISLARAGYVHVDPASQGYQLGPKVLRLAQRFLRQSDVSTRSRPYLVQLRDATGETAFLSMLSGDQRVVVAQEESRLGLRRSMEIGAIRPLHCGAASKALLAFAETDLVERILRGPLLAFGPGSTTDPIELRKRLKSVRECGYSIGISEMTEGSGAVCAPVFNHQGQVVAAIGIAGPALRLGPARQSDIADAVVSAARALSMELGYDGSPCPLGPNKSARQ